MHDDSMNEVYVEEDIMMQDVSNSISKTLEDFLDDVCSLFIDSHIVDVVDLHEELTSLFYICPHVNPFEDIITMSLPFLDEPHYPHSTTASLEPSHAPFVLQ